VVELQLLNHWLLKTMLNSKRDGVMIIKPGGMVIGDTKYGQMSRRPHCSITAGLCLENVQGSLES